MGKTQTQEQRFGARPSGVRVRIPQSRVKLADAGAVVGGCNFSFEIAEIHISVDDVLDRRALERRGLLGDVRDAPVARQVGIALVGVQLAAQQREQARLAGAVGADQAGALAGVEGEVGALQQRFRATAKGDLREADHAEKAAILLTIAPC